MGLVSFVTTSENEGSRLKPDGVNGEGITDQEAAPDEEAAVVLAGDTGDTAIG